VASNIWQALTADGEMPGMSDDPAAAAAAMGSALLYYGVTTEVTGKNTRRPKLGEGGVEKYSYCPPRNPSSHFRRTREAGRRANGNAPAASSYTRMTRVTRYDRVIDIGDRYGRSIWEIGHQ